MPAARITAISRNQYGESGLAVRAPLEEKLARYERMKAMQANHATLDQIAAREHISKERARQILAGGPPKRPGRPLPQTP